MAISVAGMVNEAEARNVGTVSSIPQVADTNVRAVADSNTLQVKVITATGSKTMSWKYADPQAETADFNAFLSGLITYGAIFENQPLAIQSAKIVTKTETEIAVPN